MAFKNDWIFPSFDFYFAPCFFLPVSFPKVGLWQRLIIIDTASMGYWKLYLMFLNFVVGFNVSCGTSSGENLLLAQFESFFPEGIVEC